MNAITQVLFPILPRPRGRGLRAGDFVQHCYIEIEKIDQNDNDDGYGTGFKDCFDNESRREGWFSH